MSIKYYSNKSEWKKYKKEANTKGESTIHDDFIDKSGNPTNGVSGRLTFGKIPEPDNTIFLRTKELKSKIKNRTISHDEVVEWLDLTT